MAACVFAALATIFGVVALILGVELSGQHPGVEWGTAPDWLAGLGTVAGFGALAVAALEWHTSQEERRWKDAAQARLIIAEPTQQGQRDFVIRNQSQLPVFEIAVDSRDGGGRLNFQNFGADPKGAPNLLPILQGGESTGRLAVDGGDETTLPIDYITYRFTDTDGLRWQRTGTEQPTLVRRPGS